MAQALIDPFDPYFTPLGHKRAQIHPIVIGVVCVSNTSWLCGFKYILVISNPSKAESGLILLKELEYAALQTCRRSN